jgi:uncharacterized protein involved in exopolysaccharide biosynthesis/Mrp family chromosome partitioning ATPase
MIEKPGEHHTGGIRPADIYYTLFRHKWKILGCWLLGILAAAGLYFLQRPLYRSSARLMVRYVMENRGMRLPGDDTQLRSPDTRGDTILNSEIEILTSWNLAEAVIEKVGVTNFMTAWAKPAEPRRAAQLLLKHLSVEPPRKTVVMDISFDHPDPGMAQTVLAAIIQEYLDRHDKIHRGVGAKEFLTRYTGILGSQLKETERLLREEKGRAKVIALEESKKTAAANLATIRQQLAQTELDLAGFNARLQGLPAASAASTNAAAAEAAVPIAEKTQYFRLIQTLNLARDEEAKLSMRYMEAHPFVQGVRNQIAALEASKAKMEKANTNLATLAVPLPASGDPSGRGVDLPAEIASLKARMQKLNEQLAQARKDAEDLDKAEPTLVELQRKRDLEEANYQLFATSLQKEEINTEMDASKISSIGVIQQATPAAPFSQMLWKSVATALAAGMGLGLVLAFLVEFYLDPTFRRPAELESKVRVPMFMSIPRMARNGTALVEPGRAQAADGAVSVSGQAVPALWDSGHHMREYCEALRDRLVLHFQEMGMVHKPKLVGVTSCAKGAGVSTVAAGLAASLSETGDGNVLLVDMNFEKGAAHPFFKGKPSLGLQDSLEVEKRAPGLVQGNLYLASAASAEEEHLVRKKRCFDLMPRLRASDYDYIIFDLPPVGQTSVTQRMAGYMDNVLLVVEAEKSHREAVQRSLAMLAQTRANVATVLNKQRKYLPAWLDSGV